MKQEFVKFIAGDGLELVGVFYTPIEKFSKSIIHVHGMLDNCYMNNFVQALADFYVKNGYAFLTFSNRGHDYYNRVKKFGEKFSLAEVGSTCEIFEESVHDISGAIKFLNSREIENIILQGHSLGCNKVIYYNNLFPDVAQKLILISPTDVIDQFKCRLGDDYDKYIAECKENLGNKFPKKRPYNKNFEPIGFTSETFINNYIENSNNDIFRYRDKDSVNPILGNINVPITVQIGTADNYVTSGTIEEMKKYLGNNFLSSEFDLNFIEQANHFFIGKENELGESIIKWLKK